MESCLEDSTTRYAHSPLSRSPCSKSITDNTDATDLFFHGFFMCVVGFSAPAGRNDCHGLSLSGNLIDLIAINFYKQQNNQTTKPQNHKTTKQLSSAYRRKYNPKKNPRPSKSKKKKSVKKIKSVASVLSVSYFERVRTEP